MTAETKIRTLASQDATLQSFFGTSPFRWYHMALPPTSATPNIEDASANVQQISGRYLYAQEAAVSLIQARFQVTVRCRNVTTTDAAALAIIEWLGTVCFANDDQFQSPPVTPRQHPNFVLSTRAGMDPQLKTPIYTQLVDFRVWNLGLL